MPLISFLVKDVLLNLAFKFDTFSSLVVNLTSESILFNAVEAANSGDTTNFFWSSKRGAPYGFAFRVAVAIISCSDTFGGGGFGRDGGSCCLGFDFSVALAIISCSDTFGIALDGGGFGGAINGCVDGLYLAGTAFCFASAMISCSVITLCFALGAKVSGISSSRPRRCGDDGVGKSPSAKGLDFGGGIT